MHILVFYSILNVIGEVPTLYYEMCVGKYVY